jgi:hypothetical protein
MISIDPNALVRALNSKQIVDHSGEVVFCTPTTGKNSFDATAITPDIAGTSNTAVETARPPAKPPKRRQRRQPRMTCRAHPEAGRPAHHTNAQLAMKASTARERTAS